MKAANVFLALVILAVSACTPTAVPEEDTAVSTAVEASEQVDSGIVSTAVREPPATVTAAVEKPEPAGTATAAVETPESKATAAAPVDTPEPVSEEDAGKIYAAAVREIYTVDHTFGGNPPEFPFVYIVTTTSDGSLLGEPATEAQELTADMLQTIEAGVSDLPFEVIWIASLDDAPVDPNNGAIAGGKGIVITLGNILPQADGSVHLPVFMVCGGLCALGKTYVLERVDGEWQVTGSVGPEIMA